MILIILLLLLFVFILWCILAASGNSSRERDDLEQIEYLKEWRARKHK
jgi:hypothetical protein